MIQWQQYMLLRKTAVHSKVILLLLFHILLHVFWFCDIVVCTIYFCIGLFFYRVILCVLSSLAIILPRMRELIALL